MTAVETPQIGTEPMDGFGDAVETTAPAPVVAAKPVAAPAAPAAPVTPAATPAATPATPPAAAKPGDGSLLAPPAPVYDLKAEGMHADDLKVFTAALGEHKVDGKVGQALLDKMLPTFKARSEQRLGEAQKEWRAENAKDVTAGPRVEAALAVVSAEAREALRGEAYLDHPALYRFVAEIGAFVQKATKQDTAVPGTSPAPTSKYAPGDTSSGAFAGGVAGGF